MDKLDGFYLKLVCAVDDMHPYDPIFQSELKSVFHTLSINDCGEYKFNMLDVYTKKRYVVPVFITLNQAIDDDFWKGVIGWLSGHQDRILRLRLKNLQGEEKVVAQIVPLLEKLLKILTDLAHKK